MDGSFLVKYNSYLIIILTLFTYRARDFPADIYLLKLNNRNTREKCELCSRLTIKTPERRQ